MQSWCGKCKKLTDTIVGGAIVMIAEGHRIRETTQACAECFSFKESIIEKLPIRRVDEAN